jgi:hypothetical protein
MTEEQELEYVEKKYFSNDTNSLTKQNTDTPPSSSSKAATTLPPPKKPVTDPTK